jgi:hypothetical protein
MQLLQRVGSNCPVLAPVGDPDCRNLLPNVSFPHLVEGAFVCRYGAPDACLRHSDLNADLVGLTECRFCSHGNLSPLRDLLLTHSFASALQAEKCVDAEAHRLPTETWVKIKLVCG